MKKDKKNFLNVDELRKSFDSFLKNIVLKKVLIKLKKSGFILKTKVVRFEGNLLRVDFYVKKTFLIFFSKPENVFSVYIKEPTLNFQKNLVNAILNSIKFGDSYKNSQILQEVLKEFEVLISGFKKKFLSDFKD